MKKYIYKITNLINGKSYIGQTNNFQRRKREHQKQMYGNCENKILYKAFEKYGLDNFSFEIIEENIENYNEREEYWINYFNTLSPHGYNLGNGSNKTEGSLKIDERTLQSIIKDLIQNILSYQEIANKYGYKSADSIRDINKGNSYYNKNLIYPIRKTRDELAHERAIQIIKDLKESSLNFYQLGEKYNCSYVTISDINTGRRCQQKNENYPIRKSTRKSQKFTNEQINQIYKDIINTKMKWTELAQKYHCNEKVFQHINQGQLHRKDGYDYPLRKSPNKKGSDKARDIIYLLQTTDYTYTKIAELLNTNRTTVANINKGKSHRQEDLEYPIRQ